MIREHDQVVLTGDLPALSLEAGDVGIVVHVYGDHQAYEVEFLTLAGETTVVATLRPDQIRAVRSCEIPHARERLAA